MEPADLYKLVYQGAMGSGHAVLSEQAAAEWLNRETESLKPDREEDLVEEIPTTAGIVRINLRPWLAEGLDTGILLRAFIRTGREFSGRTEDIEFLWQASGGGEFIRDMRQRGFPAIHHSERYRRLYHPAYRVVRPCILQEEAEAGRVSVFQ